MVPSSSAPLETHYQHVEERLHDFWAHSYNPKSSKKEDDFRAVNIPKSSSNCSDFVRTLAKLRSRTITAYLKVPYLDYNPQTTEFYCYFTLLELLILNAT